MKRLFYLFLVCGLFFSFGSYSENEENKPKPNLYYQPKKVTPFHQYKQQLNKKKHKQHNVNSRNKQKGKKKKKHNTPYDHQVYLAKSNDGLKWKVNASPLYQHASVPDIVRLKNGTLLIYFVDWSGQDVVKEDHYLSVAKSTDQGKTWWRTRVKILSRKGDGRAVDPNAIVLKNGKVKLFYLGNFGRPNPPNQPAKVHHIYSATSTDGITFKEDPGVRFSHPKVTDPDVIQTPLGWKMFVTEKQTNLMASSTDGKTFTLAPKPASTNGAISKTIAMSGGYRMYKCSRDGLRSQFTKDFQTWRDEGVRIKLKGGMGPVCDPGIVKLKDGSYLMVLKTFMKDNQQDRPR